MKTRTSNVTPVRGVEETMYVVQIFESDDATEDQTPECVDEGLFLGTSLIMKRETIIDEEWDQQISNCALAWKTIQAALHAIETKSITKMENDETTNR